MARIALPDGRVLVIPDSATPDELAALKQKLGAQYASLQTGEGMEQRAVQQSRSALASGVKPSYVEMGLSSPKYALEIGMSSPAVDAENARRMNQGAAVGSLLGGAIAAPVATARALLGGAAGAYAGGHAGKYIAGDTGETIGKTIGGLAGGVAGGAGMNVPRGSLLDMLAPAATDATEAEVVPLAQGPNADRYAAVRTAQRAQLRREVAGIGFPGSAAQEGGWSPSVTRVPITSQPTSPLTPEQVAGPDTSGRGNLLTPLAKRSDVRAAQELIRHGRSVDRCSTSRTQLSMPLRVT